MEEIITKDNLSTYTQGLKSVLSSMGQAIDDKAGSSAVNAVEGKIDIIDANVDTIVADTTTLKSDVATTKSDASTIKTKVNTMDGKLDTISTAISNIGSGSSESSIFAVVGDYLYSDKTVSHTLDSNKTVIGRCVIPTGQLPDNKARFVSLNYLSSSDLDSGNSSRDYAWYFYNDNCAGNTLHNTVIGHPSLPNNYGYRSSNDYIRWVADSDNYYYLINMYDENAEEGMVQSLFIITSDQHYVHISVHGEPQQYSSILQSNSISVNDRIEYILSEQKSNFVSDIYGYNNCKYELKYLEYIGDTSWKTGDVGTGHSFSDIIKRCWRFNPGNTNNGDWYIPSIGELYTTIQNVSSGSGVGGYNVPMDYYAGSNGGIYTISSTNANGSCNWTIFRYKSCGYAACEDSGQSAYVKPFIAL